MAYVKEAEGELMYLWDQIQQIQSRANEAQDKGNEWSLSLFQAMYADLENLKNSYESILKRLRSYCVKQGTEFTCDAPWLKFNDLYYELKAVHTILIPAKTDIDSSALSTESLRRTRNLKLPKIEIPTYTGNVLRWTDYKDAFSSLVHTNDALSDIEKFLYLKSTLKEEASGIITSLPVTSANYNLAWEMLCRRYDNKRVITSAHLDSLMRAPSVNSKDIGSLRALVNCVGEQLGALRSLGHPVEQWSTLIIFLLQPKLDNELRRAWEHQIQPNTFPSDGQFLDFLEKEVRVREAAALTIEPSRQSNPSKPSFRGPTTLVMKSGNSQSSKITCTACHISSHNLVFCPSYKQFTIDEKRNFLKREKRCFNCLSLNHTVKNCRSKYACRICSARHHSSLHSENQNPAPAQPTESESETTSHPSISTVTLMSSLSDAPTVKTNFSTVLLATAQILVQDIAGSYQSVLALLDSASQASFITESCVSRLGLSRSRAPIPIHGLSESPIEVSRGVVNCLISSNKAGMHTIGMQALVIPHITTSPHLRLHSSSWPHLANLKLADPDFQTPRPVDILLGADLYPLVVTGNCIQGPLGAPSAIQTIFGWSLIGKTTPITESIVTLCNIVQAPLDLKCFWEIEEIPNVKVTNPDDELCEKLYKDSVQRNDSGRYIVSLPFKEQMSHSQKFIGETRQLALRRLYSIEKHLTRNPLANKAYCAFLQDFIEKGYMELIPSSNPEPPLKFYVPHHAVIRQGSGPPNIRVVFDASAKSSSGKSLNDLLLPGPKLQRNLTEILMNFRKHPIVFTADIKGMFLQINMAEHHRDYQRILWRPSTSESVREYRLNTVTFGVSSSPFLAIRTLQQLVNDEGASFPNASRAILSDTYVDDIVTGSSDTNSAIELQQELIALLQKGGFQLRKWVSNRPEVLECIPEAYRVLGSASVEFEDDNAHFIKILGLKWNPSSDIFSYAVNLSDSPVTKRSILSDISRIFDPLGWVAPVTLFVKILIQHLWLIGIDWDEAPPTEVIEKWTFFRENLIHLAKVSIPRYIPLGSDYQIHGFSDSSEKGYGAVVYLRVQHLNGVVTNHLIMAKTKVAPVQRVTLPRLELCAALLLAKLIKFVLSGMSIKINNIVAWTDSMITLQWIRSSSHQWKTFVANRIAQIQEILPPNSFRYVPTSLNPADCASRGLYPAEIIEHPLWWSGPHWLCSDESLWPTIPHSKSPEMPKDEEGKIVAFVNTSVDGLEILHKSSSYSNLQRILAFCFRFIHNCRNPNSKLCGSLKTKELQVALDCMLRNCQQRAFPLDIHLLESGKQPSCKLRPLSVFLDSNRLIRVGGRLRYSNLSYERKHPILLPKKDRLTDMIIDHLHAVYQHPGPQTLQRLLREQYWIISDRDAVRKRCRQCLRCFRVKPIPLQPAMGDLPSIRLQQIKPFMTTGVDYGGPFLISMSRNRRASTLKAYICLFICLSTKAIHIELASDLTTECFLAALRRFVARRGPVSDIYSDCGTNFIGASRKLSSWLPLVNSASFNETITRNMADYKTTWHFNPPSAPHFGGIWEAGIKSVKSYLQKIIGEQRLTYEELNTVVIQIESTLNSRPLCPLSSSPDDLNALTPAHFLVQGPATALPFPNVENVPSNRLARWLLIEKIIQSFWKRWNLEYLNTLQIRNKWFNNSKNLSVDQLVLVKEDNLPPLRWRLGRITKVHPGKDGIVRVATVKTVQGLITRPVVKLCPLPQSE